MNAARALVKCLEKEGVTSIFGYPGAAICPFYDELVLSNSSIEHILVRHEANAGHAASGMARISGKPEVCVATSGPGATNLITAIATAYMDSIPIIALTGQVHSEQIGKDVFQEADMTGAVEPFVKHSYLLKSPKEAAELPRIIREAFHIAATGRPGPVLIDIPIDVQLEEISFSVDDYQPSSKAPPEIRGYKPSFSGNKLQIKRVIDAIAESKKPLICAGGGVFARNAQTLMQQFAERADIPVVNTMMGISSFPSDHRLSCGMLGMHGKQLPNRALNECDLLILLGARVNDRAISPSNSERGFKVIHVDIDPAEIGKNLPAAIPVVGDIYAVLEQILELLPKDLGKHDEWCNYLLGNKTGANVVIKSSFDDSDDNNSSEEKNVVSPKEFYGSLNKLLPKDAIVTADVGQNQIWTANNIQLGEGGRFLTSGGMGTMGYSVPCAVGAKRGNPEREVVAICGDGSFQMQFMELATMIQHGINIKIIIMANNRLGMVRELQKLKYQNNLTAVFLDGSPDFIKLADAYGINGEHISNNKDVDKALTTLLASKKPYILVVDVDAEERSIL
ncbi:MAG: biosynthetic-type acetolactate synthase large subunit [Oscillospiraceae bacterium]|nr:biosynthetic-type acetolactate synthase large subunit [Oscillospiraceae bacterium]